MTNQDWRTTLREKQWIYQYPRQFHYMAGIRKLTFTNFADIRNIEIVRTESTIWCVIESMFALHVVKIFDS